MQNKGLITSFISIHIMLFPFAVANISDLTPCNVTIPPIKFGANQTQWNFNNQESWYSLPNSSCGGRSQSPINIITQGLSSIASKNLTFEYLSDQEVHIEQQPQTLEIKGDVSHINVTDTSGKSGLYIGTQFHMHAPSEHTIDGKQYPLELHFVHISQADGCESLTNKLSVVGIMVEIDDTSNVEFITTWIRGENHLKISHFNLYKSLLFALPTPVTAYKYSGSLTTPPCSETVNWLVLQQVIKMNTNQMNIIKDYLIDTQKFKNQTNNRLIQDLNDRNVSAVSLGISEVVQHGNNSNSGQSFPDNQPANIVSKNSLEKMIHALVFTSIITTVIF